MTRENFDEVLTTLLDKKPFQIFTIELHGGRKFEVDSPRAVVLRNGKAAFLAPGGGFIVFDHESVNLFADVMANQLD